MVVLAVVGVGVVLVAITVVVEEIGVVLVEIVIVVEIGAVLIVVVVGVEARAVVDVVLLEVMLLTGIMLLEGLDLEHHDFKFNCCDDLTLSLIE